jgi:signal transduction histidine kinase
MAFVIALGSTLLGSLGLAALLLRRAGTGAARPLAGFLVIVGAWSIGLLMPNAAGAVLLSLAPLGGAAFVHFASALTGRGRRLVRPAYAVGLVMAGLMALGGAGAFVPWPGVGELFQHAGYGLIGSGVTVLLALVGHGLLVRALGAATGVERPQLRLVLASSAVGLFATSGLAFPLLGLRLPPWPLLAEPLYVVLLGYAMLRYRLAAVNVWAVRAVSFALLVAAAALGSAALAGLAGARGGVPFVWTALVLVAGLVLAAPVRRLAEQLVYPGGEVSSADLAAWRSALEGARDEAEVDATAQGLLRQRLRLSEDTPLAGDHLPPGPQRLRTVLLDLAGQAKQQLARRRELAERDRLAELGALAATVAHDLRNPMNILAMAVADAEPAMRQEVRAQLRRMEALVRDLLDYAKPWRVEPVPIMLADFLTPFSAHARIDCPTDAELHADPARLRQAMDNLLDNARAAAADVQIAVEQTPQGTTVRVCDNGPGIPADIRASLFQPFVSRNPQGTGLGLAIVAKVMAAHGGAVALEDSAGWSTCVALRFPP